MFFVFAGSDYYARGGASDYQSFHDNLNDAIEAADKARFTSASYALFAWAHVLEFDGKTAKIVYVSPKLAG